MEFIALIGIATIILTVTLVLVGRLQSDNAREKKQIILKDFTYSIQNEFIMAGEAHEGYIREFNIPGKLENIEFVINNTETYLFTEYSEGAIVLPIPNTKGNITKGDNTVENRGGQICINC